MLDVLTDYALLHDAYRKQLIINKRLEKKVKKLKRRIKQCRA